MTCIDALLLILLSLRPSVADARDSFEERVRLIRPTVVVICQHSEKSWTRAILAATAVFESGLARCVLEDRCKDCPRGMQCDAGLARGPWQVRSSCRGAWDGATREDRERAAIQYTIRTYNASLGACRSVLWGGFIKHRGWRSCDAPWAANRYHMARWIQRRLDALTKE